jgi:flagellar biosynthesis chaperone FliJ
MVSAAELKNLSQIAKRDLKKQQALLSEALSHLESSQQQLTHLRGERNQREQRAKQYQEHYQQMNEELTRQLESHKIDKAERQMQLSTLSQQVLTAKEGLTQGQKEVQGIAREGALQAGEGVRRLQ